MQEDMGTNIETPSPGWVEGYLVQSSFETRGMRKTKLDRLKGAFS